MRDTALCIPLVRCKMVPVVFVLIQELGLRVVHTVQAQAIKVFLNLGDCTCDDMGPVPAAIETFLVSLGQAEVFLEGPKIHADSVDRFAALLIDGISIGLHKCPEVLEDGLLLATTSGIHRFTQRGPKPSGKKNSEMATSGIERICEYISC
jgi:hypothetical protein